MMLLMGLGRLEVVQETKEKPRKGHLARLVPHQQSLQQKTLEEANRYCSNSNSNSLSDEEV
jgi:hypothetical protein